MHWYSMPHIQLYSLEVLIHRNSRTIVEIVGNSRTHPIISMYSSKVGHLRVVAAYITHSLSWLACAATTTEARNNMAAKENMA